MGYRFVETGVGCQAHDNPECLCDVTPLPGGVPIVKVPNVSRFPTGLGNAADSLVVWGSDTLGRFEALYGIDQMALNEALALWQGHGKRNNSHGAALQASAVSKCLQAGLSLEQAARWLGTTLHDAMDQLYPRDRHEVILQMEKMIRGRKHSSAEIAAELGLPRTMVSTAASRWGVKLPRTRVDPRTAEVVRLVSEGHSRRKVAEMTGVGISAVCKWTTHLPKSPVGRKPKEK